MSLNLSVLLTESAKKYPTETAIIYDSFRMTYGQLDAVTNQFAQGLARLDIHRGDKVALLMPNLPQFIIAYFGIVKLGAVVVPINILLRSGEIEYALNDSEALALITWEGFLPEAVPGYKMAPLCRNLIVAQAPGSSTPLPAVEGAVKFEDLMKGVSPVFDVAATMPDDTAVIIYTSGTTGKPKGAELTHLNMLFNAQVSGDRLIPTFPGDVGLAVLPLYHSFGQSSVMNCILGRGAALTLLPRFDPAKVLEVMERDHVTVFCGVPTMYFSLLNCPERKKYNIKTLKYAVSGGSAMPVEVLYNFEKEFDVPVLEGYGLSETSPTVSFNVIEKPRKAGSIGIPVWGVEVKVFDKDDHEVPVGEKGEIVVKGHNVMKGYYNRPEATAEAMTHDWLHTGDLGYKDEEGYFFIVDRKKDMIIRGGYNVYPREVEEVMYQHPAVREVAVIGVPDAKLGEEIKAFVSLKTGASITPAELVEYARDKVAYYKYPREVAILDELPKNSTGKILKTDLRKLAVAKVS